MNILSDEQYHLLGFIAACNGSSYHPTATQVMLWRDNPEPANARYKTVKRPPIIGLGTQFAAKLVPPPSALNQMVDSILGMEQVKRDLQKISATALSSIYGRDTYTEQVAPAESAIAHMTRLTWLEGIPGPGPSDELGLRLTELGLALLRDHENESNDHEDVSVVILEGKNPLSYPLLVGLLANTGAGLLIDPYLKLEALDRLIVSTRLTRLLISGKPGNERVVSAVETYLASANLPRTDFEVRKSTDLHDRLVLAENGVVSTLGTSLNGVGKTTTVLTPMPARARGALRGECERLWAEASLVGRHRIEAEQETTPREPKTPAKKTTAKKTTAQKATAKKTTVQDTHNQAEESGENQP